MKVLILGSEGFVGQNLVNGLSISHDVYCADLFEKSNHENYQQFDITNLTSVDAVIQNVDVVINLAAHSLVSSLNGTIQNAYTNIIGLLNVLESCKKNNISKIIFTSASSLIGEPKTQKVSEEHFPTPKTAYGITKLTSENYLRLYNELYGINYVVFRFFNIYGPYQKNGLIPSLFNRIISNEPLTIFGNGDQIRDYVFIQDLIPIFDKSIISNIADNQIVNLGTGIGTTIKEIIQNLSKILQVSPKLDYLQERPGEIGNFVADTNKLEKIFGPQQFTNVELGLEKTVSWLQNTKNH